MFLEFYRLREQPFGVTPDPRFLYLSPARIARPWRVSTMGSSPGRGFMALIAKPGMGKTTLLFQLLEKFRSTAHTAFLFFRHNARPASLCASCSLVELGSRRP